MNNEIPVDSVTPNKTAVVLHDLFVKGPFSLNGHGYLLSWRYSCILAVLGFFEALLLNQVVLRLVEYGYGQKDTDCVASLKI